MRERAPGELAGVALAAGLRLLAAGGRELDRLRRRLAVLALERDPYHRSLPAEVSRVDQIPLLAAEHREAEVPDRGVGDHRDDGLEKTGDGGRVGPRNEVDLAIENECEPRKAAG